MFPNFVYMGSYLLICETQSLTYLWHQGGGSVCFKEALLEGISAWTLKGGWSPSSSPQVLYLSTSNKRWNQTLRQLGHSSFWILMPRGSPVLVMIFEFSIGVSLRIAHKKFLTEDSKGDWYILIFSNSLSCHLSHPLGFKFLPLG